jgi:cytochrome c2
VNRELFGVKDILVQRTANGVRILASHNQWFRDRRCNTLRVSSLETTVAELLANRAANAKWKTVFDTSPCLPLPVNPNNQTRNPSLGAGGRMVALSDHEILLSVGGMGPETRLADSANAAGFYGTTTLIDLATGKARVYTLGHRNPQGLAVSSFSEIWLTEHGARGGDELNRIVDGQHYGYPHVSYGTEYNMMVWPTNPQQGRHEGYAKPMHAWTPGIGISQMIVLEGKGFPYWQNDLLVSSLTGRSLFRVRVEEGRVIFSEQIPIGHRIRDIVEATDGSIVLKTDDNLLMFIRPVGTVAAADRSMAPEQRGELLAFQCQSCHSVGRGEADRIGPNLWGVVGRSIAAQKGYDYSPALRAAGGRWTEPALRQFLSDPNNFAPGTKMATVPQYDAGQIDDLIAYLKTLD